MKLKIGSTYIASKTECYIGQFLDLIRKSMFYLWAEEAFWFERF